ncbi:trk system potassium uptake protein TrkA [Christiangramia gaetbulicola]|uniref:Trk system potassium uptake protein TrkA n=1 Tax=Christiangramia gaetbulicola TaxID=703340 RepID=A0A2T6AEG9_9FLAO|nr:TrkA family potassium uptake protein [Christiangramia gaetbulicola]PTX42214.1 trk system potassium uptake protein TrkA [Christiangramia gaetbulicola]
MKYIVVGLGVFGASISEKLAEMGNEVIGVDISMSKVEAIKEKITHAISLDATDMEAVKNLPLDDTDVVIIGIGEDKGANIMAAAVMKQMKVKRLISRAVDPLQRTVLETMGVDEIIHPEKETADRWAQKLNLEGVVDSFEIDSDFSIVETKIPEEYHEKTIKELNIKDQFDIIILTTMSVSPSKNELGTETEKASVNGVARADTVLYKDDIMVLYGHNKNIKRLLEEHKKFKEGDLG